MKKIVNSEFIISAVKPSQYPTDNLPEIVFVGKSNVGKSSLINILTNRKKLARTSSVPGKTRLINFYKIQTKNCNINDNIKNISNDINKYNSIIYENTSIKNEKNSMKIIENKNNFSINSNQQSFYFVDLPGYGFSRMSKEEQIKVGKFIEEYLKKSENIALIIFVIDIRHEPTSDDKLMYDYIIKQNLPCIVVCNKADKIAVTKVDDEIIKLQEMLNPLKDIKFLPFSTERKIYTQDVLDEIFSKAVLK